MPARWFLPSDPCAICGSELEPHACGLTITRPGTLDITLTGSGAYAVAYPCAFSRAIRDA